MPDAFFRSPILNSPYAYPRKHWELDADGQPTDREVESRRTADFVTPIPKPRKRGKKADAQQSLTAAADVSDEQQAYEKTAETVNTVRRRVDAWRKLDRSKWGVTPETARLLDHWRNHDFAGLRPFFCQVEAVETAIWLTEVAPTADAQARELLAYLADANEEANPGLNRLALKLATGAGKTTVMAMLIAWQTINAARRPTSKRFTRGFLIVAPGLTIRDRLRVLIPNDPNSYYARRELVPRDLMPEMDKARIVLTNYHAFKLREKVEMSKGTRGFMQGRGEPISTQETQGQMIQRVMPELMGLKNVVVLNDEAHHCYREKPGEPEEALDSDQKAEAKENGEAARLWITGLETLNTKLGVSRVFDLSATPFFLAGSGYREGTLFPWTMSDFSLMDAIECGIVKLPRVPVADNSVNEEMPEYRELWKHIGKDLPKGNRKAKGMSPDKLPDRLVSAIHSLYGHYAKTFELWQKAGVGVPPCFIVVCNNTATSKLLYDWISGYETENEDGSTRPCPGRLDLFRNTDDYGNPVHPMPTLLIDSRQLESGDALDASFREAAGPEIDRFRAEIVERTGDRSQAENLTDAELLREVMNTVGKKDRLGEQVRCVVSVSMLTEGWDANNVTHILGVRAFGTQLLCEQVIGRALRRQSYEVNEKGHFEPEYADVFGIPFDFTAKAVQATIQPPRDVVHVKAMPERANACEIAFPRVEGYRVELPVTIVEADFTDDSTYVLTPDIVGASITHNAGIVGEGVDLTVEHLKEMRFSSIVMHLTSHILHRKYQRFGGEGDPEMALFGKLKPIVRRWLDEHLECRGNTYPAQILHGQPMETACNRIADAITRKYAGERPVVAVLAPYNATGTTADVSFTTTKPDRWDTTGPPPKSHLNWHILDSDWEAEFCRVAEGHPKVLAYVKNHNLGFEVPYTRGAEPHRYRPDFLLKLDDGQPDPLNLVVEIKGFRGEDAKEKASTMETYWVPGVNHLGAFGRWAFAEFRDPYEMQDDFAEAVERLFAEMVERAVSGA